MVEKVTTMVLKVDLHCSSCYKKIKKVLCKFPQIRNQVYDDKANTVTITVVCCNPEKIRDKLCCRGGKTIKSIEIKPPPPPPKPKEPLQPKEFDKKKEKPIEPLRPKDPETIEPLQPKESDKKKEKPIEPLRPQDPETIEPLQPRELVKPKEPENPKETVKLKEPVSVFPVVCCGQCYQGNYGGACYQGYGRPVPCYDGYGYPVSRCDYFNEENPSACTFM